MCLACDRDALRFTEIETIAVAARAGTRPRRKSRAASARLGWSRKSGTLALEDFRREETRSR
jgi:hypothetical protein